MMQSPLLRSALHSVLPLLEVVFPNRCIGCDHDLPFLDRPLCALCAARCVSIHATSCLRCGAEPRSALPSTRPNAARSMRPRRCSRCQKQRFAFRSAIAALRYGAVVRTLIHALKFEHRRESVAILGEALVEAIRARGLDRHAQVVVPLPLHPWRRMRRGFDQAELLARFVARDLALPLSTGAIRRCSGRPPQSVTATSERSSNVAGAFMPARFPWSRRVVRGKRVLLIDDVMTTGASLDAAARALRKAGARRVDAAVAAT